MDAYQRDVDSHQLYKAKQAAFGPGGNPGNGNEESQQVCPKCKKLHNSTTFVTCLSGRRICSDCTGCLKTCFFRYELIDVGVMIKLNMDAEHYSCAGCFKEAWRLALNDRSLRYPPDCWGKSIVFHGCEDSLGPEIVARYHEKHEEFSAEQPVYCKEFGCGSFLGDGGGKTRIPMHCVQCNTSTCSTCRQPQALHTVGHNIHSECPVVSPERLRVPGVIIVNCPGCHTAVEKAPASGCDALCWLCDMELCAKCGASIRPYEEDCDHSRDESDFTDWARAAVEEKRVVESEEEDKGSEDEEDGDDGDDEMRDYPEEDESDDDDPYKTDDEDEEGRPIRGESRKHRHPAQ